MFLKMDKYFAIIDIMKYFEKKKNRNTHQKVTSPEDFNKQVDIGWLILSNGSFCGYQSSFPSCFPEDFRFTNLQNHEAIPQNKSPFNVFT